MKFMLDHPRLHPMEVKTYCCIHTASFLLPMGSILCRGCSSTSRLLQESPPAFWLCQGLLHSVSLLFQGRPSASYRRFTEDIFTLPPALVDDVYALPPFFCQRSSFHMVLNLQKTSSILYLLLIPQRT